MTDNEWIEFIKSSASAIERYANIYPEKSRYILIRYHKPALEILEAAKGYKREIRSCAEEISRMAQTVAWSIGAEGYEAQRVAQYLK